LREKPRGPGVHRFIVYKEDDWILLQALRKTASRFMQEFQKYGLTPFIHGSVARGDIKKHSDIDIIFLSPIPSYKIEIVLDSIAEYEKYIMMATPSTVPKAVYKLPGNVNISIPLLKLKKREEEFYKFGGIISSSELASNKRVAGVNKKLLLILPKDYGHEEFSLIGNEVFARRILGVSMDIIWERERVLIQRNERGRTGVFLNKKVPLDVCVEKFFNQLLKELPPLSKALRIHR